MFDISRNGSAIFRSGPDGAVASFSDRRPSVQRSLVWNWWDRMPLFSHVFPFLALPDKKHCGYKGYWVRNQYTLQNVSANHCHLRCRFANLRKIMASLVFVFGCRARICTINFFWEMLIFMYGHVVLVQVGLCRSNWNLPQNFGFY
jgi:hypothetical protein